MGRKILGIALLAFLAYYVVSQPDAAANSTRDLIEVTKAGGDSGVTFLHELTQGGAGDGEAKG